MDAGSFVCALFFVDCRYSIINDAIRGTDIDI